MIKIEKVMNGRSKETNFLFDIIQPEGRITLLFIQLDALPPVKGAISTDQQHPLAVFFSHLAVDIRVKRTLQQV